MPRHHHRMLATILTTVLALVVSAAAAQSTLTGRIVGISDGDTITLLDASKTQHRIRIEVVDAPEKGQAFEQRLRGLRKSLGVVAINELHRYAGDLNEIVVCQRMRA